MPGVSRYNPRAREGKASRHLRITKRARWTFTVERLLNRYDRHLDQVAGLTRATRRVRGNCIQQFLQWYSGGRSPRLRCLKARDISHFVQERAVCLKPGSVRVLATALRSFLRFLHFSGRIGEPLARAVVCPPPWPHSPVPETLSEAQVRALLKSFDRTKPIGRRDLAIALCLCRLGLRAMEVASLRLEDVDWQAQTLHLQDTKARQGRLVPLPSEVARAIQGYLQKGRPRTACGVLFVRHRAPWAEGQGAGVVQSAMRKAFARCGLNHGRVHLLRHTFATRLHRRGLGIKTIADLLGHRSLDTTNRYARVNFDELRQAALPWPGEWR